MVAYYCNGKKYTKSMKHIENITVIGDKDNFIEITIPSNAPSPFVYGAKTICLRYYPDKEGNVYMDIYDVINNKYINKVPFKGREWLDRKINTFSTLPDTRREWFMVKLHKG